MRHEAAPHIKQRQIQTNTTKFKLNPQVLLWRPERFLQDFLRGVPAKAPAKGFCSGTLQPRNTEILEFCKTMEPATLDSLEPCNFGTLLPYPATLEL